MANLPPSNPSPTDPSPGRSKDGAVEREKGHRKHRRPKCAAHLATAKHAVLDRLLAVGTVSAPDLDDALPPGPSGNKTYVGTAILDLRRAGMIVPTGPPIATTRGGRHTNYLFCWRLCVDADTVRRYLAAHPIPDPDPEDES
ncbi:hypothetical protein [Tautonia rosea]|uniref:hypothetical protein n=1 Tax=Tautonia rosea TaxID=2728037 RepID=UPI0014765071|nr:hypothetical protein [Tautonia rosea]